MTKIIESQLTTKQAKILYKALALINNDKDIAKFLRDLMTLEEMTEMVKRFEVAKLLAEKNTFREIAKNTGVSSATIARINYWLHHGTGGYDLALEKLK